MKLRITKDNIYFIFYALIRTKSSYQKPMKKRIDKFEERIKILVNEVDELLLMNSDDAILQAQKKSLEDFSQNLLHYLSNQEALSGKVYGLTRAFDDSGMGLEDTFFSKEYSDFLLELIDYEKNKFPKTNS